MTTTMVTSEAPPGTVLLSKGPTGSVIYQPQPSDDPEDPLNWTVLRKAVNFGLVLAYVLFTFVLLDIAPVSYGELVDELGMTYRISTIATAVNFAGLAIGCIFILPFTYRYGRRPIYILSLIVQLVAAVWTANVKSNGEYLASNFLMGLGGAISETIVQITIVDLYFVHQYATTNGIFLFTQGTGAYLGPVAAGYVVVSQGWRWMWWWCTIFIGATVVLVLFCFEESKYTRSRPAVTPSNAVAEESLEVVKTGSTGLLKTTSRPFSRSRSSKPLRERLALYTDTNVPIRRHFWAPMVLLFTFPAVAYTAVTFGSILSWYAVMISIASANMIYPPYNFSPSQIGLLNLAPFVGQFIGGLLIAPLSDLWIVRLAKRNDGIYEPEMRLWLSLPGGVFVSAGIFTFGIGIAHNAHWAVLAVGMGIYAAGFNICLDIALAYLADCYPEIIGDALVAVVFVRNALAVVVSFALDPWLSGMGLQNMFVLVGVLATVLLLIPLPLLRWGKQARAATTERYASHVKQRVSHETS